jgi:hypothetical protein
MQRQAQRAQRKADERDARYQRREAGMRAGQIPPSLRDGLIAHTQAKVDRSMASGAAWSSLLQELEAECSHYHGARATICGPDGVEVSVLRELGPRRRVPLPGPPSRWHGRRRSAVAGYYASLPFRLLASSRSYVAYAYTTSVPPDCVIRHFPSEQDAVTYLIYMARRIHVEGVEALRQEARPVPPES